MQISVSELEEVRNTYANLGRKLERDLIESTIAKFCTCENRKIPDCTCEVGVRELLRVLIKGKTSEA
jgi:hypothetical protein